MSYLKYAIFALLAVSVPSCTTVKDHTGLVNLFTGTAGDGNTFPGAAVPFGSVKLSPDTKMAGPGMYSGYYYPDSSIIGFSHTHLNGVGEPEYRDILFMPGVGKIKLDPGIDGDPHSGYRSVFNHRQEEARPGYYSVFLKDSRVKAELTVTPRCGFHRYTFPASDSSHIIIDLSYPSGAEDLYIRKVSDTEIEGMRRSHGWAWDQYVFFTARFSKPFTSITLARNDSVITGSAEERGKNIKASVNFSTSVNEAILVKVSISAVSCEGARKNLDSEISDWNFDRISDEASDSWNRELSKIEIEGGSEKSRRIFYTSMYHAFLSPDIFMDADGSYRGVDHKIHKAEGFTSYTVFSLWDTFRALHPLFTIIDQKRTSDFISSLLQMYDDGGRLPMWPLAGNYTDDMLGYHSVSVIADAYLKGIRGYDTVKAYEAVKHSAELDKLGLKYYKKTGYLPSDRQGESVSKTLEYCYDDWCISRMALAMGNNDDYLRYHQRAHNYENVYDSTTGFMRGRNSDRTWLTPFNPLVNSAYSEGNAYQYMFVPQDIKGLIRLEGGDKKFSAWLDTLFSLRSGRDEKGSIGQYWHGNEPGHHLAYLYNYTGEAWKTQEKVHKILTQLYSDTPEGLAGNEDCGQMSAWYILSSMGIYQVAPGLDVYAIGTPLFAKTTINLENGRKFVIRAENLSDSSFYIQSATLNGKTWTHSWIRHDDIMKGGELVFKMGKLPETGWGTDISDRPFSENGNDIVSIPYIKEGDTIFLNSTSITLACDTHGSQIRYTTDGNDPDESSPLYTVPLIFTNSVNLKIQATDSNSVPGMVIPIRITRAALTEPVKCGHTGNGLRYDYFERFFVTTADIDLVKPVCSGITNAFSLDRRKQESYFGFRFSGLIRVPADGIYTFFLKSNDGSRLFIDGQELIENDGNHGAVEEPGQLGLRAGFHRIMVKYIQCGGGKSLFVSWKGPGFGKTEIDPRVLFHEE